MELAAQKWSFQAVIEFASIISAAAGALFGLLSSVVFNYWFEYRRRSRVVANAIVADCDRVVDWAVISVRGYINSLKSIKAGGKAQIRAVDILRSPSIDLAIEKCDTLAEQNTLYHLFRSRNLLDELNDDVARLNQILSEEQSMDGELPHLLSNRIRDYVQLIESFSVLYAWAASRCRVLPEYQPPLTKRVISSKALIGKVLEHVTVTARQLPVTDHDSYWLSEFDVLFAQLFPNDVVTKAVLHAN